jgi:hypothetical protein
MNSNPTLHLIAHILYQIFHHQRRPGQGVNFVIPDHAAIDVVLVSAGTKKVSTMIDCYCEEGAARTYTTRYKGLHKNPQQALPKGTTF